MDAKTVHALVFWGLALFTVVPAIMLLVVRDVIRCSVLLLSTLSAVAGLFLLLGADFLAFVQVIVYIGGILILLMYGVMLTDRDPVLLDRVKDKALVVPSVIAALFVLVPTYFVAMTIGRDATYASAPAPGEPQTSARRIGELLLTDYVLPFEVISLLLLAALVGAAYIARMGNPDGEGAPGEGAVANPGGDA